MGVYGDGGNQKKSRSRGATDVQRALASLGQTNKPGIRVDWGDASPDLLARIVVASARIGALASFGTSRDRGAYYVRILHEGESHPVWIPGGDDVDAKLEEIAVLLDTLAE